jgi:phosphoribosyl-AMP cyclohydrolase
MVDIAEIKYDDRGLVPVIVQDSKDGRVLMMAYMNESALKLTIETGFTHFHSRSRKKMWKKGESSGHTQAVNKISIDCDGDTILVEVVQNGPGACHTGHRSCFFRDIEGTEFEEAVFDAAKVYK